MDDTIAAVSTPFGEGAIALIRLSGPASLEIADRIFRSSRRVTELASRVQQFGRIVTPEGAIDEAMLTVFRAPASYTGEDVVEISCHGGLLITRKVLESALENGARSAEPGEFTQRAFLLGKMDLTQAEAVMDLISAQTSLALRAATEQLEGRLGDSIRQMRETLLDVLAHVEAHIDFPEEGIDPETGAALQRRIEGVLDSMRQLLRTADQGRVLREGVRTVIYGQPNVGKSSLLNLLLGYDRAIVSETPGTTRDTIEEVINLRGIPLRLIDTAGLRTSGDAIEQAGMDRTRCQHDRADLILHVFDGSQPKPEDSLTEPRALALLNKADLGLHPDWRGDAGIALSCTQASGLDDLGDAIFRKVMGGGVARGDSAVAINARHQACLKAAAETCEASLVGLREGLAPELLAVELRETLDFVGEVVGRADVEELLGRIFSNFCIGK